MNIQPVSEEVIKNEKSICEMIDEKLIDKVQPPELAQKLREAIEKAKREKRGYPKPSREEKA